MYAFAELQTNRPAPKVTRATLSASKSSLRFFSVSHCTMPLNCSCWYLLHSNDTTAFTFGVCLPLLPVLYPTLLGS